jgi:S-formylglutathione hydrolase FrmB
MRVRLPNSGTATAAALLLTALVVPLTGDQDLPSGDAGAPVPLLAGSSGQRSESDHPPGPGHLDRITVPEPDTGRRLPVLVYRPGVPDTASVPVLYLLHGLPGAAQDAVDEGITTLADDWIRSGGAPFVLVAPDGNSAVRNDSEWADSADGADTLETFVTGPVRQAVEGSRPRDRDHRAIGGVSMGGYGALNIGLHHADLYGSIVSVSGYGTIDDPDGSFGDDPGVQLWNSPDAQAEAGADRRVLLLEASQEQPPARGEARRMAGLLTAAGATVTTAIVDAGHGWPVLQVSATRVFGWLTEGGPARSSEPLTGTAPRRR